MNLVVLANCQNVTLASLLKRCLGERFDVVGISHTQIGSPEAKSKIRTADIVITQPLSQRFGEHAADRMKARLGDRCCVVPALFFRGYFPDLAYVGDETNRVRSPIGDYHSAIVLAAFLAGRNVSDTVLLLDDESLHLRAGLLEVAERSLNELREREKSCDVQVAEFIGSEFRQHPLFLTTNHPTAYMFKHLAALILERLDLPGKARLAAIRPDVINNNLLAGSVARISPVTIRTQALQFSQPLYLQPGEKAGALNKSEFIQRSFKLYQAQPRRRLAARIDEWAQLTHELELPVLRDL